MTQIREFIGAAGIILEAGGVFIIILGCLIATARFLISSFQLSPSIASYHEYRRFIGRSIILGLEFLIAGDIISTVMVSQTLSSVVALAMIVLIRAFLSITLELGIEGHWPWVGESKIKG